MRPEWPSFAVCAQATAIPGRPSLLRAFPRMPISFVEHQQRPKMRAVLFARATGATFAGRRSCTFESQAAKCRPVVKSAGSLETNKPGFQSDRKSSRKTVSRARPQLTVDALWKAVDQVVTMSSYKNAPTTHILQV